jgi:hypothetical protein
MRPSEKWKGLLAVSVCLYNHACCFCFAFLTRLCFIVYFPSMEGVLPKYFHSEWSVAQFRLQEGEHYIVAFGHEKNTVAVVGMDGR